MTIAQLLGREREKGFVFNFIYVKGLLATFYD